MLYVLRNIKYMKVLEKLTPEIAPTTLILFPVKVSRRAFVSPHNVYA